MTSLNSYWEPIHTAAYFNNYDSLREELDSGISPNLIMNNFKTWGPSKDYYTKKIIVHWNNMTPLYIACYRGNDKCVKLLMERGADPNISAYNIYHKITISPLNVALTFLKFKCATLLKKKYKKDSLLRN